MKECCHKSVFSGNVKRIARCNYICEQCNSDVSTLWAFYALAQTEQLTDIKKLIK